MTTNQMARFFDQIEYKSYKIGMIESFLSANNFSAICITLVPFWNFKYQLQSFPVAVGIAKRIPSSSGFAITWQPRRDLKDP